MPLPKKLTLTAKSRTVTAAKAKAVVRARNVSQSRTVTATKAKDVVSARNISQTRGLVRTTVLATTDSNSQALAIEAISAAAWMFYGPSNVPLSPAVIKARVTGALDAVTKLLDHSIRIIKKRWYER